MKYKTGMSQGHLNENFNTFSSFNLHFLTLSFFSAPTLSKKKGKEGNYKKKLFYYHKKAEDKVYISKNLSEKKLLICLID